MARLLIHNTAPPLHPTDEKINAGMFQVGHVVTIIEDGESFGDDENAPHVTPFEAVGTPKKDLEYLLTGETVKVERTYTDEETKEKTKQDVDVPVAVRMWKIRDVPQIKMVSGVVRIAKGAEVAFTNSYFEKTVDLEAVKTAMRAKGEVVK